MAYQSRVDEGIRNAWGPIANDELCVDDLRRLLSRAIPNIEPRYVCGCCDAFVDFVGAVGMPRSVIVWDKEVLDA